MAVRLGRFGAWAPQAQFDGLADAELGEIGAELEAAGYGALWLGGAKADLAPAVPLLGGASTLALATGIVNVWSEPVEQAAATYHRLSGAFPGRFLLGIGAGHREATHEYEKPYDRVNTYLDGLASVPSDDLALAALGPKVLRLGAARTAGVHPYLVPPEHTRFARETIGDGVLLAPEQKVVLETDPTAARAIARTNFIHYLKLSNYVANLRRLGYSDDDFAGGGSDRLVDALYAWGDEAAAVKRVTEHLDAGADHVSVQVVVAPSAGSWRSTVLPREQLARVGAALSG
jgi:probable F420-dependent oxidoreductase